jgi:hypothetical protein
MKRNTLNLAVDLLTPVSLLSVLLTGLTLKFVLPPGSPRARWTLLELTRHQWGEVHFWTTVALGALLLVHVVLHWQWLCCSTSRLFLLRHGAGSMPSPPARSLAGAATVVLLVAAVTGSVLLARAGVQTGRPEREHRAAQLTQPEPEAAPTDADDAQGSQVRQRRRAGR